MNAEKRVIAPTKRGQNLGSRLEVKWELNSRDMDEGTGRLEDIWTGPYCPVCGEDRRSLALCGNIRVLYV